MTTSFSTLRRIVSLGAALFTGAASAEVFVDVGASALRIEAKIANQDEKTSDSSGGLHLGVGLRRALSGGNDIGVRLELDDADSDLLLAIRALDYRFNLSERLAVGAFFGAARLDLATPAYGYYLGGSLQVKDVLPSWDLGIDLKLGDKVARDNLLPTDPQGGSRDNFYDVAGLSIYLSRRF